MHQKWVKNQEPGIMKNVFMKRVIFSFLLFSCYSLYSQVASKKEFVKSFQEADAFYNYDQNYARAAEIYENLLRNYPDNSNLSAKLGICYLNLDGKKKDALRLLSKAVSNVVANEEEYLQYGEKASLDTYLYLAIAYHQNDSLQKAILLYSESKEKLSGTKLLREEYIDNQIRDCRYALGMKKKPLVLITDLFAQWLTDYPGAMNPVLSKNDSVFIFTQKLGVKTRILCSYKSGTWRRPVDITKQLGGFDRFYSNSITGNGKLLIIYMDDGGDGNLYYSERKDTIWSKIRSIGRPINNIYWQSHGFITPDGQTIYYTSNEPGGEGELDIWYSEKNSSGKWNQPVNCGNVINTPYNEDTPFFDEKSSSLLFSSDGHTSMGGYDVFRSIRRNGTWTNPIGMPYAFNTTLDNYFFILNNNKPGFITSLYNEKTGSRNIYEIVAEDPADKITLAIGTVTLQDGLAVDPKQTKVLLADLKKVNSPRNITLGDTASFKFEIKPGDYQLFVSYPGYKTDTMNLTIPLYYSGSYVSANASLIPDKVFGGEFLSISNVLFEFNSYSLSQQAKTGLEILKSILITYPELKVEIAGYTDAIGSLEYNRKLADKRAQAVINYLTESGTSSSRFVKKAFGESDFVALNNNPDGSDNPEGRKYNRRVTFGIVDPKTGVTIRQETYTPEHLRQPFSLKYSIVLLKTKQKLGAGHFSSLTKDDMLLFRTIETDSISIYSLGVFFNRIDALKYLEYARGKGFDKAYIVNQYELENESKSDLIPEEKKDSLNRMEQSIYTIQLKATRNELNIDSVFGGIEGVKVLYTDDGFYKYYYGEFSSLSKAKEVLMSIKKLGFEDAFVRNLYSLIPK
jgi:outer membrane protein OmpA-like peptidoglycan-associated protein/tetratricopeptide (TPR) repeat protein